MDYIKMMAELFGRDIELKNKACSSEQFTKLDNREWNAIKRAMSAVKDLIQIEKEKQ